MVEINLNWDLMPCKYVENAVFKAASSAGRP